MCIWIINSCPVVPQVPTHRHICSLLQCCGSEVQRAWLLCRELKEAEIQVSVSGLSETQAKPTSSLIRVVGRAQFHVAVGLRLCFLAGFLAGAASASRGPSYYLAHYPFILKTSNNGFNPSHALSSLTLLTYSTFKGCVITLGLLR